MVADRLVSGVHSTSMVRCTSICSVEKENYENMSSTLCIFYICKAKKMRFGRFVISGLTTKQSIHGLSVLFFYSHPIICLSNENDVF